jgi:hypothetical protein
MFGRALPCGHLPDQSDIQQAGETLFVKEENAMNTSSAVTLNKPAAAARRGRFSVAKTIVILFLSILVVTQVYPLLWLVLYSLKTNEEILSGSFFALPHAPQWSNYSAALEGNYFRYLLNSLFVTSVTMAAVILLSSLCAYAISRFRWPDRDDDPDAGHAAAAHDHFQKHARAEHAFVADPALCRVFDADRGVYFERVHENHSA